VGEQAVDVEEVCAMDDEKGPLVVSPRKGAPTVRLALMKRLGMPGEFDQQLVYVTYARTDERDSQGRPIYR
jgi:hypothetical protein